MDCHNQRNTWQVTDMSGYSDNAWPIEPDDENTDNKNREKKLILPSCKR